MEIWKDVIGREGEYEVSNLGRIRSVERVIEQVSRSGNRYERVMKSRVLSPRPGTSGRYLYVTMAGKSGTYNESVHSVVAKAFVPNPENKPEVRHLNGDSFNNFPENLMWGTHKENEEDKKLHGTIAKGEKCGASKITEVMAREIKIKVAGKKRGVIAKVARECGVSRGIVGKIANNKAWTHI